MHFLFDFREAYFVSWMLRDFIVTLLLVQLAGLGMCRSSARIQLNPESTSEEEKWAAQLSKYAAGVADPDIQLLVKHITTSAADVQANIFFHQANNWLLDFQFAVEGVAQSTVGVIGMIGED